MKREVEGERELENGNRWAIHVEIIQVSYLGELSCAKQFIVCTGLSFNLGNNEQRG